MGEYRQNNSCCGAALPVKKSPTSTFQRFEDIRTFEFEKRMPDVEEVELFDMHGRLGREEWAAPIIAVECNTEARPGYASMKAHEYEDDPETLS